MASGSKFSISKSNKDKAFNATIAASSVAKDIAEMLDVPFAKGAASILNNILKTIQTIENNKEGCLELAVRATKMLTERKDQLQNNWDQVAPGLTPYLNSFESTLQEISNYMDGLAKAKFFQRFLNNNEVTNDLRKFNTMLSDANQKLQMAIITEIYLVVVKLQQPLLPTDPNQANSNPDPDPSTNNANPTVGGVDPDASGTGPTTNLNLDPATNNSDPNDTSTAPLQPPIPNEFDTLRRLTSSPEYDVIPPPLPVHILRLIDPLDLLRRRMDVFGSVDSVHHLLMNERVLSLSPSPPTSLQDGSLGERERIKVGDLGYFPNGGEGEDFAADFLKLCNILEDGLASYAVEKVAMGEAWAKGTGRQTLDGVEMFDGNVRWTVAAPPGVGVRARIILSQAISTNANVLHYLETNGDVLAHELGKIRGRTIAAEDLVLVTQTGHDQDAVLKKRGKQPSVAPPTYVHFFTSYNDVFQGYLSKSPNPAPKGRDAPPLSFEGHSELLPSNRFVKFVRPGDRYVFG